MNQISDAKKRLSVRLEQIPTEPDASLTVRQFRQAYFPFNWHYHPQAELTFIVRGRGLRFVGDSIENYREGDLCLLGSNLPHFWQSPDDGGAVHSVVVQFDPQVFDHLFVNIPEARAIQNLMNNRSRRGLLVRGKTVQQISKNMQEMAEEPGGSMRRIIRLMDCLQQIADAPEDTVQPISTTEMLVHYNHEQAGNLRKVLDKLDESLGDVLPQQSDLAKMLGMTPAGFSRLFKRVVGKNYIDYLNEWRVGLACRRLLETNDAIIDVALAAGFENLSNFHRRFMAIKGMTPGQFRMRSKQADQTVHSPDHEHSSDNTRPD